MLSTRGTVSLSLRLVQPRSATFAELLVKQRSFLERYYSACFLYAGLAINLLVNQRGRKIIKVAHIHLSRPLPSRSRRVSFRIPSEALLFFNDLPSTSSLRRLRTSTFQCFLRIHQPLGEESASLADPLFPLSIVQCQKPCVVIMTLGDVVPDVRCLPSLHDRACDDSDSVVVVPSIDFNHIASVFVQELADNTLWLNDDGFVFFTRLDVCRSSHGTPVISNLHPSATSSLIVLLLTKGPHEIA
ncbi:hypothetical protein BLNAU_22885 [Blattamonas nauphoetae]|uniref:Uncharacterized protein n=1 Tax=Blattamonas nauphoetae TaxID=2049346 RepID=A0ABQ9WRT2_9EUKA|nr:hypothetical protein BLNAU_22885 [Blattamonas nauphoetae]